MDEPHEEFDLVERDFVFLGWGVLVEDFQDLEEEDQFLLDCTIGKECK